MLNINKFLKMTNSKCFINISEVASFIGQSMYDVVTPFERLWKRYDKNGYEQALDRMKNLSVIYDAGIAQLDVEKQMLSEDLENKKITERQYALQAAKIEDKVKVATRNKESVINCIDSISLNQKQRLGKTIGDSVVSGVESENVSTDTKRQQVSTAIENLTLDEKAKSELRKEADSFINKTHGTLEETNAIAMFEKKFKVKLDTSQQYYKRKFKATPKFEWFIGGKVDGLYVDPINHENSYIVEVKNRTRGFFSTLRPYEKTQIQLYMWILDIDKAKLVEKYQSKLRITDIYRDETYTTDILDYLDIFLFNYENGFLCEPDKKLEYIGCDKQKKEVFLKKLYLNDIYKCERRKLKARVQASEDSDTDSDDACLIESND